MSWAKRNNSLKRAGNPITALHCSSVQPAGGVDGVYLQSTDAACYLPSSVLAQAPHDRTPYFSPLRALWVTLQTDKSAAAAPPPPPPPHRVTEGKVHHRLMSWWKLEQASCYLSLRPTFLGRRSIFIPNAEKLFFPLLLFPGNLEAPAATAARALGKTAADEDKNNYGARVFQRHFLTFSASLTSCFAFTSQPDVLTSMCCWKVLVRISSA